MKNLKKKCVEIVKQNVRNGIVVTEYKDLVGVHKELIEIKCIDYIPKKEFKGYVQPEERFAKQLKPLMRFTQEY